MECKVDAVEPYANRGPIHSKVLVKWAGLANFALQ